MAHNGLKLAAALRAKIRDNTGFPGVNCLVHLPASAHAQGGLAETLSGPDSHETGQGLHGHLFGNWEGGRSHCLAPRSGVSGPDYRTWCFGTAPIVWSPGTQTTLILGTACSGKAVRVIRYRQHKPNGEVVEAYWLTNFSSRQIRRRCLYSMAKSRWCVENEGFHDAKNRDGLKHIRHHHERSLLLVWLLTCLALTLERLYRLRYLHHGLHPVRTAIDLLRLLVFGLSIPWPHSVAGPPNSRCENRPRSQPALDTVSTPGRKHLL